MEKTIRSLIGAAAGIFITLAFLQVLWTIPEFRTTMIPIITGMISGLIVGAIIFGIVGIVFFYLAMRGR